MALDGATVAPLPPHRLWRWPAAAALAVLAVAAPATIPVFGAGGVWKALPPLVWVAAVLLARLLVRVVWPDEPPWRSVAVVGVATVFVTCAVVIGFLVAYGVTTSANLCGADGSSTSTASLYPAGAAYLLVGALAATGPPRRALWLWPLAVLVAVGVDLAVTAAIPSNHGEFCET
jgi:hypothetical protein